LTKPTFALRKASWAENAPKLDGELTIRGRANGHETWNESLPANDARMNPESTLSYRQRIDSDFHLLTYGAWVVNGSARPSYC
jgi:hypothetical protein